MKLTAFLALVPLLSVSLRTTQPRTFHHENVLGTSLELKLIGGSDADADRAETAVLNEIDRLDAILSTWNPNSEVSRWARTTHQPVQVSPELAEVLGLFDLYRVQTNGALNASVETATRLWKRGTVPTGVEREAAIATMAQQHWTLNGTPSTRLWKRSAVPTLEVRQAGVATIAQQHWTLDSTAATRLWKRSAVSTLEARQAAVATMAQQHWTLDSTAATHLSNAPLALNSFVKSYIISKAAAAALASPNITGTVVNIGGDIVVRGDWQEKIQIADPRADAENSDPIGVVSLRDRSIATSGDYRRGVNIAGTHYSHIIDPRTAQPASGIMSSTVIAENAAEAGALATAFSILKPEESAKIAVSKPGVEYLLIASNGARFQSRGWSGIALAPKPVPPPTPSESGMFDSSYELVVNLELARIEGRARRPYVAVWIEDKDKFPIRTIALWLEKTRWLPDLKAWYRDDKMRSMAEGKDITQSVSSATRAPGKYTLKWDGKDNTGKLVKAGTYTVNVEAAREHGTYQLIRQDVDFSGTPKQFPLPGNTEISSVNLDYRKATH